MELRDYQLELLKKGIEILERFSIVYYVLEMRLGKTFISIFTANHFNPKIVYFVTKKKAITNIEKDFKDTGFTFDFRVINYESIHKINIENTNANDIIFIFDEAHRLGGYPKKPLAVTIAEKIVRNSKIIYLSGTPTPETESQLYHQFRITPYSPFKHYNFYKWAEEFVNLKQEQIYVKGSLKTIPKYSDAKSEEILKILSPYFIRYSQKDAGFEQSSIEERIIKIRPTAQQNEICFFLKKDGIYQSPEGWQVSTNKGASIQSKFHQIYSGTLILDSEDDDEKSKNRIILNKNKALIIKQKFEGQKIAIFYKFKAEYDAIKSVFENITDNQYEFNESDNLTFVGQISTCREGINLATADFLVFYNISFSALDYWQTRARFQDKNRTKPCIIYWLMTQGGIEEKIYESVTNKKNYTLQYFKKDFLKTSQLTFF